MADVQPLNALHYALDRVGGLPPVVAPPYDVIDAELRARLAARSPYNVVEIDLPEADGDLDIYAHAAQLFSRWKSDEILVRDPEPALWALAQDYTGPDGNAYTRRGFFARVRVEDYGPGRIRPHERTHPGPKEDRLRLTRATHANLSPIFSLYDDPVRGGLGRALAPHRDGPVGRGHRRRRHQAPALARRRRGRGRRGHRRARADRAADRRRPPPLRDRPRLRRGGRRRGRAPLRAHVPRRPPGPRADRLPHPPAADRPARRQARRPARGADARLGHGRGRRRGPAADRGRRRPHPRRLPRRPPPPSADAHAQGPGDRRRRAARACPSPTAGSTPPCWRR